MKHSLIELSRNLAQNLITLRKKRGLTQARLAELSGATRASIALIESGTSNPTMEVLIKLSRALQVSIDELFSAPVAECSLIKSSDVKTDRKKKGISVKKILPEKAGPAQIDDIELEAGSSFSGTPHVEGTREFFTCIEGNVSITVLGKTYSLNEGDVLSFPGDKPHGYKNTGRGTARGFSVVLVQH